MPARRQSEPGLRRTGGRADKAGRRRWNLRCHRSAIRPAARTRRHRTRTRNGHGGERSQPHPFCAAGASAIAPRCGPNVRTSYRREPARGGQKTVCHHTLAKRPAPWLLARRTRGTAAEAQISARHWNSYARRGGSLVHGLRQRPKALGLIRREVVPRPMRTILFFTFIESIGSRPAATVSTQAYAATLLA